MSSHPSLRLRLMCGSKRVIFPIPSSLLQQPIKSLYPLLERQLHLDTVLSLRTPESFAFSSADIISDALRDNDDIVVVDRQTVLRENIQRCTEGQVKRRVSRYNVQDDVSYCVEVGQPHPMSVEEESSGLFVRVVKNQDNKDSIIHLEVFELSDLMAFFKEGKQFIVALPTPSTAANESVSTTNESDSKSSSWSCVAEFIVDSRGYASALEVALKCDDDLYPVISRVPFSLSANSLSFKGDVVVVSDPNVWRICHSDYKLPDAAFTGWKFDESVLKADSESVERWRNDNSWEKSFRVETLLPVNIKPRECGIQQHQWYHGKFGNNIWVEYDIFSRSPLPVFTFDSVEAEYSIPSGGNDNYKSAKVSFVHHYEDRNFHSFNEIDTPWQLGDTPQKITFLVQFDIEAPQSNRRKRIHSSLPSPMKLRFKLRECNGGTITIYSEMFHEESLQNILITPQSLLTSDNSESQILGAIWADDSETLERFGSNLSWHKPSEGEAEDGGYWCVRSPQQSGYSSLGKRKLRSLVLLAQKTGNEEQKIDEFDFNEECSGWKRQAFALIDKSKKLVYAIRIQLQTKTSETNGTFFILPDCGGTSNASAAK